MVGDGDDGAEGADDRRSVPAGAPRPLGATVLESDAGDERPVDGMWHPSRPPLSAESALLETGVRPGRAPRLNRKRVGWLLAAAGLGVLGFFGIRAATAPRPGAARPPSPEVLAVPVVSAARPTPAEPRVTPIIVEPSGEPGPRREAGPPQTRTQALQPAPRAKPPTTSPSGSGRGATAAPPSASDLPPLDDEIDLPPSRAAAPGRGAAVHGDDPWNPDAFGDRR